MRTRRISPGQHLAAREVDLAVDVRRLARRGGRPSRARCSSLGPSTSTSSSRPIERAVLLRADRALDAHQLRGARGARRRAAPCPSSSKRARAPRPSSGTRRRDRTRPSARTSQSSSNSASVSPGWPTMNAVRNDEVRDARAQALDQLAQALAAVAAAHAAQHAVGRVLERHVDVRHDRGWLAEELDELVVELLRVEVEEPHPAHARRRRRRARTSVGERRAARSQIAAVGDGVLRDEVHLDARRARRAPRPRARRRRSARERCLPRSSGITQNEQVRLQPSAIFTYALRAARRDAARIGWR